jgi:hypothetical protein
MVIVFANEELRRVDRERNFDGDFDPDVADEIRHRLQILRAATSDASLLSLRSLDPQVLGNGRYLLRITDRFWLNVQLQRAPEMTAVVLGATSGTDVAHTA